MDIIDIDTLQQEIEADESSGHAWVSPGPVSYRDRDKPVVTNNLHIELSPDLDKDALVAYIHDAMDKAAAQMAGQYRFTPRREPAEWEREDEDDSSDIGHIEPDGRWYPSKSEIRAFIREEVHRALYPSAEMANPHEHMRVEMVTEQGKKWRGVLYGVEEDER